MLNGKSIGLIFSLLAIAACQESSRNLPAFAEQPLPEIPAFHGSLAPHTSGPCDGVPGTESLDPTFATCGRLLLSRPGTILVATAAELNNARILIGSYYVDGDQYAVATTITTAGTVAAGPDLIRTQGSVEAINPNEEGGFDLIVHQWAHVLVLRNGYAGSSGDGEFLSYATSPEFLIHVSTTFPDGSLIAAGGYGTLVYSRFTSTGEPDSTFGQNGTFEVRNGVDSGSMVQAISAMSDGGFVSLETAADYYSLVRRSATGEALWKVPISTIGYAFTPRLHVDEFDRITVVGLEGVTVRLGRFLPSGSLDAEFHGDGRSTLAIETPLLVRDSYRDIDGSIFILCAMPETAKVFEVVHVLANGDLDTAFGANGIVRIAHESYSQPIRILVDPNTGGVYVVGSGHTGAFVERLRSGTTPT